MSDSLRPHGPYIPWHSPGHNAGVGSPFPSPGDLPNPGIKSRSPTLQMDSLPAEPQGKPRNTGKGSLSLLQGIFVTQESNQGLLHCRLIFFFTNWAIREAHMNSGLNSLPYTALAKVMSNSAMLLTVPPGSSVHGLLQARIVEWVAFPFSRGSSQPRDQTQVSCIAGGFFTSWATREAQEYWKG